MSEDLKKISFLEEDLRQSTLATDDVKRVSETLLSKIMKLFIKVPNKRNLGLVSVYHSESLDNFVTNFEKSWSENWITVDWICMANEVLGDEKLIAWDVAMKEFRLQQIGNGAYFSTVINPFLHIDYPSPRYPPLKAFGICIECPENQSIVFKDISWDIKKKGPGCVELSLKQPIKPHPMSQIDHDLIILRNPENHVANQMFNLIKMLEKNSFSSYSDSVSCADSEPEEGEERDLSSFETILDAFANSVAKNDTKIFPKYNELPRLRTRLLEFMVTEMQRMKIDDKQIREKINARISTMRKGIAACSKILEDKAIELEVNSVHATFTPLVPYLSFAYPERESTVKSIITNILSLPGASGLGNKPFFPIEKKLVSRKRKKKRLTNESPTEIDNYDSTESLLVLYWRIRWIKIENEILHRGRKFWDLF